MWIDFRVRDRWGGLPPRTNFLTLTFPRLLGREGRGIALGSYVSIAAVALASLTLAGCMVGPDFVVPALPLTAGFTPGGKLPETDSAPVDNGEAQKFLKGRDIPGDWWRVFHSRQLDKLVADALLANPSLEAAQATLWQAQETLYAQAGVLLPSIDGNASATRQQFSPATFGQSGKPILFNLFQTSVNVSYSPDLFGGKRRQIESNEAQVDYQRFELEATYLTLTANVVTAAIQEFSLRGQIEATEEIIKAQTDQLDLIQQQFNLGSVARTDVLAQQSELAQSQATLPVLQKQLAQQRHLLQELTGRFPNEETPALDVSMLRLPTNLPVSLPSRLVEQRPDIRAAEAQLHQASAQVGVAIANRLPQINLTGEYGSAALSTATLLTPGSIIWNIGASATQPIFHGGTLLHQERAAEAAYEAAAAQYKSTVLMAFQNVADVLKALQADATALSAQDKATQAASDSLELIRSQYRLGSIPYVNLLTAQRTYQQARLTLVQAQAARLADTAALYQALGGGWWNRADVKPDPFTPEGHFIDVRASTTTAGRPQ
ncbi:MAG TPA: efflux transporter outer membrane subunit [Xanthobacteraceae bacterium]|nr:efflux transporter outer membrane subunit [Xanthobacteraceae bacterium]